MPRPSRGRKNRRNRNTKRANNSAQQGIDQLEKSAISSGDRNEGDSTGISESPRGIGEQEISAAVDTDLPIGKPKNVINRDARETDMNSGTNTSDGNGGFGVTDRIETIMEENSEHNLTEAKINGHAVKVTTEETTDREVVEDKNHNDSVTKVIGSGQSNRGIESLRSQVPITESTRRRLRVERRTMKTETKIVEIRSLTGITPLEASIDHVAGVGILEIGKTANDEADGIIVTISEPPEPVRPLPSNVASKVDGLILDKGRFERVTPLATTPRDNNNNDENEGNDGPVIREVTDSDAETDNSINTRSTPGTILIVEAESDVERDSTLDQPSYDTIAEESEDQETENLSETEDRNELDETDIPGISSSLQIQSGTSENQCKIAGDAKTSGPDFAPDDIDIVREVSLPIVKNAIGNDGDTKEEEFRNRDITEIPGVNHPVQPNNENVDEIGHVGYEISKDDFGPTSQQLNDFAEVDEVVSKKDIQPIKTTVEQDAAGRTDTVTEYSSENCDYQDLNSEKRAKTSEVVLENLDLSKVQLCPEKSSSSQVNLDQEPDNTNDPKAQGEIYEHLDKTDSEGHSAEEFGERSSSIEDDSLQEKFDEVVKANEAQESPNPIRDTEPPNSVKTMNTLKAVFSSEETDTSKDFDGYTSSSSPTEVDKALEPKESSVSKDVENKLRLFIKCLDLPALNDESQTTNNPGFETTRGSSDSNSQRRAKKRFVLDSYYGEAKHADRFLDIIQEEGEKLSECDERHIRDFINEEICKFRRENRGVKKQMELHAADEAIHDELPTLENEFRGNSNDVQNTQFFTDTKSEVTIVHDTTENTHEVKKSTNETRVVVTKKSTNDTNANKQSSINKSNEKSDSNVETRGRDISNANSAKTNPIRSCGETAPPVPPKRFSNFVPDKEPFELPTPPEIDYPIDLPKVPALPAGLLIGLQCAPVPPQRTKKWRRSTEEYPKRPPLPKNPFESNDRAANERVYENIENVRLRSNGDCNPPSLPPLPRDFENFETGNTPSGYDAKSTAIFEDSMDSLFEDRCDNDRANIVGVGWPVSSSPETLHREHRRKEELRNHRSLDEEPTHYAAGNDACFEIAASVGNRCAYSANVPSMPPEAPLSYRNIIPPNSRHLDSGRRRPELSNEFSRPAEPSASQTINTEDIRGKNSEGRRDETEGGEDRARNDAVLNDSSYVTLKNDRSKNKVIDPSDKSEFRGEVKIVPIDESCQSFHSASVTFSKTRHERNSCQDENFSVELSGGETTLKEGSPLVNSWNANLGNSVDADEKRSIDDSSVTFSEEKPGSRECVENNQPERPKKRSQQQPSATSASSPTSRLLRTKRSPTCSSQGQTNSVTTLANKNSVDDEHRMLPTLIVTQALEKNSGLILRSPSPERNQVPDDQESSSSGAATPNTVRFNPSNSFADLASLEVHEDKPNTEIESSDPEIRSTSLEISNDEKVKATSSKSQVELDPYYVPVQQEKSSHADVETDKIAGPDYLKNLCIRKILSLPCGLQIINEITLPEFNIYKSIQAIQESISGITDKPPKDPCSESGKVDTKHIDKMNQQRRNTWMGVPTLEDPKLLVCLSPSQQKSQVRTSVDNLLDLHKKFINRRSYHEDDRNEVDVPKYWVELGPKIGPNGTEFPKVRDQRPQEHRTSGPGNRLLEIIKENPIEPSKRVSFIQNTDDSRKTGSSDLREDRLRATRLSDWLALARRDAQDCPINHEDAKDDRSEVQEIVESDRCSKTSTRATRGSPVPQASDNENTSDAAATANDGASNNKDGRETNRHQLDSPLLNEVITTSTVIDTSYERIYDQVISQVERESRQIGKRLGDPTPRENRLNPALIVKSKPTSPNEEPHPGHQFDKCPISLKSAIIDKSGSNETPRKRTPPINLTRGNIDPRASINPALIDTSCDHRVEQGPTKHARPVVVDRSCIDTTSIFDKTPPSSRLAPRKYQDPEALKHDTAADIIKNLKLLQSDTRGNHDSRLDERRRYSLPQECFDRQLHYIEQLENQLREVILAEEEERRAYEEFLSQANRGKCRSMMDLSDRHQGQSDTKVETKPQKKNGSCDPNVQRESWPEDSRTKEDERSEFTNKHHEDQSHRKGESGPRDNGRCDPNIQRESWHEESRTREGHRSEFTKREGHRLATKSVSDQGDVRIENSTITYEDTKETRLSSDNEVPNGDSADKIHRGAVYVDNLPGSSLFHQHEESAGLFASKTPGANNRSLDDPKSPLKTSKSGTLSPPNGEVFRRKMFDEYVHKVHEREERKQHKVVKLSSHVNNREDSSRVLKGPTVDTGMSKMEREFIERARNRMSRFGIKLDESSESEANPDNDNDRATKSTTISTSVNTEVTQKMDNRDTAKCLIDGREINDPKYLPKHLQEFLELATSNDPVDDGVWSPGSEPPPPPTQPSPERTKNTEKDAGIPPVWTPSSAGTSPVAERKEFRSVAFESPVLSRKKFTQQAPSNEAPPPWRDEDTPRNTSQTITHNITTRIVNSHSAPSQGLNTLAGTPRLPRAQNPTITLLQKAREGQLPKGAAYLEDTEPTVSDIKSHSSPRPDPTEIIHTVRREYESEPETSQPRCKKMTDLSPRKIEGIGPTTKDGIPVALRSEVKDTNQARWYKKMYDSLHRADKDDDYITVRYKPRRGARYGYGSSSGYLSEPEPRGYSERSATLDTRRRQRNKENDFSTSTMPRKSGFLSSQPEVYRNQPGRIENYEPGRSSIAERETKEWWDEVMDIFDGWLDENGRVRRDRGTDRDRSAIPPLETSHQGSRVLSLPYKSDSSDSVSLLSPLMTSRPAKSPESTANSSSRMVQRLIGIERSTIESSTANRVHKITDHRPSTSPLSIATPSTPDKSRANPVPHSLLLDSSKSLIPSSMERSRYGLAKSPIVNTEERRVQSMTYAGRNSRKTGSKVIGTSTIGREDASSQRSRLDNEKDRIIRPIANHHHYRSRPTMFEGKSKSFVMPDRDSTIPQRTVVTGSQSNLAYVGTLAEHSPPVATSVGSNDNQRDDNRHRHHHRHHPHHHHHHHHHHLHHQCDKHLPTSNTTSTAISTNTATPSSSSSSCTSSTNHNATLLPSSMPTIANINTAKNPQSAAPSRPFDQRTSQTTKPYMSHALKESGYESDSTLIFRRRDNASPLSPIEQRIAYKTIQKGGDVPLHGLRKPAPERPKDDTEIEYFPISPTLTRIRVRRRTAITRTQTTSMSSSSMTFARCKRTSGNSAISPRNGPRPSISTSSTTRTVTTNSPPPPGRPSTRVSSPTPPSPPRRRSSRHNVTLKTLFVKNSTPGRSSSCPDRGSVCPTSRRHEQCFAAERASNIRFLRERLSYKLSEQIRDRETSGKYFGTPRSSSTSPSSVPRSKAPIPPKLVPQELPKRSSEPCLAKNIRDPSSSPTRKNNLAGTKLVEAHRRASKSASPVGRHQELVHRKICDSKTGEKPFLEKSSSKGFSHRTIPSSSANSEKIFRQTGRTKTTSSVGLNPEERKACRTKKESSENSRRFSSSSSQLVSTAEAKKTLKQRERDRGSQYLTTGSSVVQKIAPSTVARQKSVESKSGKSVSTRTTKSSTSLRTSSREPPASSKKYTASPSTGTLRPNPCGDSSSVTSRTKRSTKEVRVSTSDSSVILASDICTRKRVRAKIQTIVKQPSKRPTTIEIRPQGKRYGPMGREVHKEPSRVKKVEENVVADKRKVKKTSPSKASLSKTDQPPKIMKKEFKPPALSEHIKEHQRATRTDKFFQNLFLRDLPSAVPSQTSTVRRFSVMERARMFQEATTDHFKSEPSLRSLSVYLANKRPVSNSRFKNWERESLSSRSSSPYGVSWPGRSVFRKVSKFDSLLGMNEYGSSTSLRGRSPSSMTQECPKERSLSEPPLRINCSEDTRNAGRMSSPTVRNASPSPMRSDGSRSIKISSKHPSKTRTRSVSDAEDHDHSRSNFGSNLSLTRSTGSLESPPLNREDYQRYLFKTLHVKRKSERYKELHDFYASLERMGELERTTSASDLPRRLKDEEIIDYDRWKEIRSKERAELELREIYGKLKNVQRDKDFLFSTRDVDKYKWRGDRGLRCKERSVENIRESFRRLENEESKLESTRRREMEFRKDVYKPLWRGNSVANVASNMSRRVASKDEDHERASVQPTLQKHLGGSKKFWSSLSIEQVTTLKNQLNEIYGTDINGKPKVRQSTSTSAEKSGVCRDESSKASQHKDAIYEASRYDIVTSAEEEFGDGLEEKKTLQSHPIEHQTSAKSTEFSSEISPSSAKRSIATARTMDRQNIDKTAPLSVPLSETEKKRLSLTLGKEILDKVTKMRASTTPLAPRETRGAIASVPFTPKSSSASTSVANISPRTCYSLETSFDDDSPRAREKSDFLLVLTPNDNTPASKRRVENVLDEWSRKPSKVTVTSGSEIDSATESSETSVKTVVRRGSEAEVVPRKVEFFEKIKRTGGSYETEKTADERLVRSSFGRLEPEVGKIERKTTKLSSAQSFADLKELFGEVDSARYTSFHKTDQTRRSTSPENDRARTRSGERSVSVSPEVSRVRGTPGWNSLTSGFREVDRARSVSPRPLSESTCSLESWRNRSVSPDPERYWRAYLSLVKNGSVRKLRAKFESLEELTGDRAKFVPIPKRFQSDPELTRNLLKRVTADGKFRSGSEIPDVAWLRRKYEPARGRARKRTARSPPIPRIPLRLEDLSMPRINVISKTAELKDIRRPLGSTDSIARRAETEELEAKKPVGRIREKFERQDGTSSLLGEMFTSVPNVHELRDIVPYLSGPWIAHEYPSRRDNARSLSLPPDLETTNVDTSKPVEIVKPRNPRMNLGAKKIELKRNRNHRESSSSSPARPRTPTSILKQPQADPFANQNFDPSKHRPKYRYQPPQPPPPPPVPIFRRDAWWPPMPTYTAKPSVTFEGPISFRY